jgi:hypothetical protein
VRPSWAVDVGHVIMNRGQEVPRIGVLWRGDRRAEAQLPRADRDLGPLYDAFARLPVVIEAVPYSDDAVDEVRQQLRGLDGVLVWVNPIQDGANRGLLDPLLREVAEGGVWVSAHPDVILQMGTKEILYRTRDLAWGSDTSLYRTPADFGANFPARLGALGRLVLKQGRGNGGNGVWKIELPGGKPGPADPGVVIRVQDARSRDGASEHLALGSFMRRCEDYFAWSGCLVDQPFQDRLVDGMLRCYFTGSQVVGFCQQWPKGLLDEDPHRGAPPATFMDGPDVSSYQPLRVQAETECVPQMLDILGLDPQQLPVIWDADFLFGPKSRTGDDTYVLCEINVSAVWPFPPMAAPAVAAAALDHTRVAQALRRSSL